MYRLAITDRLSAIAEAIDWLTRGGYHVCLSVTAQVCLRREVLYGLATSEVFSFNQYLPSDS